MQKYDTYKESGIEWIGEIPEYWRIEKVRHNLDFGRGLSITKRDLKDEGIPCINYGEIHSKYGFRVDPDFHKLKKVDEKYLITSANSLLQKGDFVFADTSEDIEGSGNFSFLDSSKNTFAGYHTVILRRKNDIDYKFLAYLFDSTGYRNQIRSEVYGVKVFSITQAILKNTTFVFPPSKSEQTQIANYLDRKTTEIDQLIADKKALVELYKEEKTAIINQAVTKGINPDAKMKDSGIEWLGDIPKQWRTKPVKHVSSYFKGMAFKSQFFKDKGVPIIKASNIKQTTIKKISSFISVDNQLPEFERVRLMTGDIIVSTVGSKPDVVNSAVGQIAYIDEEYSESYLNQNTICIRAEEGIKPKFLKYICLSNYMRSRINSIALWIANQAYIEVEKLRGTYIPIPELQEQIEIIKNIEREHQVLNSKILSAEKYIDLLIEYKTALISEVVTGKVKITEE